MPYLSWSRRSVAAAPLALAAALALTACATAPAPGPVARDETGVVVQARPIVASPDVIADVTPSPAALSPAPAPPGAPINAPVRAVAAPLPEPTIRLMVIADAVRPGETQYGVSYTIRRDRDGTLFEVFQPELQALAQGTRVRIAYGERTRISPAA